MYASAGDSKAFFSLIFQFFAAIFLLKKAENYVDKDEPFVF